jgi:hypothetical protein
MPNSLLREINSFRSIYPCPCDWQVVSIAIRFVALCISFPEKSMISGGYRSSTLFTYYFNYVICLVPLQSYFVSFKISILANSL